MCQYLNFLHILPVKHYIILSKTSKSAWALLKTALKQVQQIFDHVHVNVV